MIDGERLSEQMERTRFRYGRLERLENGEWVPWPVLPMDKLGRDEAERVIARSRPRSYAP